MSSPASSSQPPTVRCIHRGWVFRPVTPDLLEYADGPASCLINIGYPSRQMVRPIYATESISELFPNLREHVRMALPYLKGSYVIV